MELKFDGAVIELSKPQDSRSLLKVLIAIRKEVEWPRNRGNIGKLREKGCFKHLVRILNMQKNVVDVSLSILGNCIMDKGCARDVIGIYNILTPLDQLLKRYPEEDSVNGRIFRIIGNMCYHKDQWANIIIDRKPSIVSCIVEIIKKASKDDISVKLKYSEGTVLMAIRALRVLLNGYTVTFLVKTFEVLKAVGALFIKLSVEWQKEGKNEHLLQNIIKLLHNYSKYKYYNSILQMRNTDMGDSLLYLSNVLLLAPKRIVMIIMNFIRISQLKSELPIPEICDKFVDVVLKNLCAKELNAESMEYIHCLCFMLDDPANRNSERCGKCLPLLIQVLQGLEKPTDRELELCVLILSTLNKCAYNDNLIQEQLKCNILQVLLKKLQWIVGDADTIKKDHKRVAQSKDQLFFRRLEWQIGETEPIYGKRRKCQYEHDPGNSRLISYIDTALQSPCSSEDLRVRQFSPCSSDEEISYFNNSRYDRSPSSCSSIDSDNPFSSCSSPQSVMAGATDSDSDDYSPVCSETDAGEFPLPDHDEVTEMNIQAVCEVSEFEEDVSEEAKKAGSINDMRHRLLTEIISFIRPYILIRPPLPQLGSEELLLALLKCSQFFNPSLGSCISPIEAVGKILESPEYLIPLMKNTFIETIYELLKTQHKSCSVCVNHEFIGKFILRRLSSLAESEVGKGDIAHRLLRGTNDLKQQLVLVIPYIIRNKNILAKLMLNCGGLELLMQHLQEESALKERTCKVLCAMAAKNLQIANPAEVAMSFGKRKVVKVGSYKLDENCISVVTFKLDDGTSLQADREFLSEKSDFFSRLLNGHFKESNQDEICLHNVELKSLRCLLQLLKTADKTKDLEIRIDLETLLDVIVLSDRYLMSDLCEVLINSVEKFRISKETVPTIYRWALESGTNLLRVESVAYALVANINDTKRLQMFKHLFDLGYHNELLEDIHKLLVRYLSSFQGSMKVLQD